MDMDPAESGSSGSTSKTVRTAADWRAAGERGDVAAAGRCLAAGIEVVSPLTAQFRFHGQQQVKDMLAAAFEVISDIRYHTEVGDDVTRALFYRGRCGSEHFEEAQLLRFDRDGLITELTLFGRPLPGVTAVMAAIGPCASSSPGTTRHGQRRRRRDQAACRPDPTRRSPSRALSRAGTQLTRSTPVEPSGAD